VHASMVVRCGVGDGMTHSRPTLFLPPVGEAERSFQSPPQRIVPFIRYSSQSIYKILKSTFLAKEKFLRLRRRLPGLYVFKLVELWDHTNLPGFQPMRASLWPPLLVCVVVTCVHLATRL
jgi:hypothetical protein